ncbi:hypothetical protein BCR35DRAFT_303812 [Leucosporidium creatinivorum]|uniref:BZIP domain-containing protein n=1 Tax=Leucosporidium creatinivorum TaxID=106004 RepID=A0A1Y2FEP8_9BASI|nr:hypothetical protein BCR35DRAFT_303812 [Leucosporidium creatinivorum]
MNSFAFSQLNVLTPSPGVSPNNGPEQDRSELTLSFPVEGSALQAQLEAWTNTTFSFDDFGPAEFKEKDEGDSQGRYGQQQQQDNGYSFGLNDSEHVDLESLLAPSSLGPAALDPFHDYAPLAPSLVDPALHLPNFNSSSTAVSTTAPGLLQAPAPTPVEVAPTPAVATAPATKRAAPKAKKAKVAAASTPASDASASPGLILGDDEAANALAIEEDKRRRNTAASARFRIKKKQREAALEQTAKELRDRVAALEGEVEALRTENGWLRGLITEKPPVKGEESDAQLVAAASRKRTRVDDAESLVV